MSVSGMTGAQFGATAQSGAHKKAESFEKMKEIDHIVETVQLDPGELERWKEIAGKPLWDQWLAETEAKGIPGQKIMDALLRSLEKYK